MRTLLLAALFVSQACIDAPPATQFPMNPEADMPGVEVDAGDMAPVAPDMSADDMNERDEGLEDMPEDMVGPTSFVARISLDSSQVFIPPVPLFGTIEDDRLRAAPPSSDTQTGP